MSSSSDRVIDPVCLMQIEPHEAVALRDYQGRTFYFCTDRCRQAFDQDPDRYAKLAA